MKERLQGYIADFGACAVNAFDFKAWQQATTLAYFGMELRVRSGAMRVALTHITPDGRTHLFSQLDCLAPGSAFSPPICLAEHDGLLLPIIEESSEDVEFDIYFGTDDTPATPWLNVCYLFDATRSKASAGECVENFDNYLQIYREHGAAHLAVINSTDSGEIPFTPDVSLLSGTTAERGLYEAAYGELAARNFTHVCQIDPELHLDPEMFARTTALLRYLRPGWQVSAPLYRRNSVDEGSLRPKKGVSFGLHASDRPESADRPIGADADGDDVISLLALPRDADIAAPGWRALSLTDLHRAGMPCPLLGAETVAEHDLRLRRTGVGLVMPLSFWALQKERAQLNLDNDPERLRAFWIRLVLQGASDIIPSLRAVVEGAIRTVQKGEDTHRITAQLSAIEGFLAGPDDNSATIEALTADTLESRLQAALERFDREINSLCIIYRDVGAYKSTIGYWAQCKQLLGEQGGNDLRRDILTLQHQLASAYVKMEALRAELQRARQADSDHFSELFHRNRLVNTPQVLGDLNRANQVALTLMRQRHSGQRAFIIGNGPSLRLADLDMLRGEITFASNKIYLAFEDTDWRPSYYSVEDTLVMQQNIAAITQVKGTTKIFPDNMRDFGYHEADATFAHLIPPRSFDNPLSDPGFPDFSHDLRDGICWGSTVIYSQIQMAVYMGCTEIYLIGVDHTYQLPETTHGSFYLHDGEKNHFHPDYRAPGEAWHKPNLDVLEVSYARARDVCADSGVAICNASRQTKLGVFERVDFDSLF